MSEPFLGQIQAFGFNFPPRGWLLCEGQLLPISQNSALFSLLGTTFGGDGRTTFGLPDLRGRSLVGVGTGPGLSQINWGEKGGAQSRTLLVANLPAHSHTLRAKNGTGTTGSPSNAALASAEDANRNPLSLYADSADTNMSTSSIANTGSGQSFGIRSPFLGVYYSIATQGVFPSRS